MGGCEYSRIEGIYTASSVIVIILAYFWILDKQAVRNEKCLFSEVVEVDRQLDRISKLSENIFFRMVFHSWLHKWFYLVDLI